MFPYIVTFFFPAIFALLQPANKPWKNIKLWLPAIIYLIIFIGLRHEVGSDWFNYLPMFENDAAMMSYADARVHDDPFFWLIMVWVYKMGWTIHIVNLISAIIFVTGLTVFVRRMPNPWLALLVAISYTVLTLGMGYVRQGVALGLSLWAITALLDKRFIKYIILIIIAAGFHKSAIIMLGFGLFQGGKSKYLKALASILMAVGVYMAFVSGNEDQYVNLYIDNEDMHSSGAIIRTFMNVIAAFVFFIFRKKWKLLWPENYTLWLLMALASLAMFPMVFILSTATDRIALYLIPLQFVVFSSLPMLLKGKIDPKLTTSLIILYYGSVYFVWLGFASYAYAWVPYHTYLNLSLF